MTRFLAAVGDANDPVTWSGIPFHFLQAAKRGGLLDEGLPLDVSGPRIRFGRVAWNLARMARLDRPGGYQYSPRFLERWFAPARGRLRDATVVNCFQLFPPSVVRDDGVTKWFFIDQTLAQLFDHYGLRATVGRRIAREAVQREREGYQAARGVIVHSRWAADSVLRDYGVAAARVHVVIAGANLDADAYAAWERDARPPADGGSLKLVFVGKDWQRKGLDRLLRALALARAEGAAIDLRVIGCARSALPPELQAIDGVEWIGFVDKRGEAKRFLDLVAGCDVGCLLSRAEAGGIALREYHALGLAVLGTQAGGAPEHAFADAALLLPVPADDAEVAAQLLRLAREPGLLAGLRAAAWRRRREALWSHAVGELRPLLGAA